ncbi:unnamed protein product [Parnassius apollo]|uniref:(apollo) hypothetical protein n=1 Tax=Parnassius apollo TaxID=110799 RepID=A0A8S3Y663_PARAO|nr:unnamed protein product [Parnassius apollo]
MVQLCTGQDYGTPSYNPDAPNPTNDYSNPSSQYDNPYDPNRRNPNRNPYDLSQYDTNRNQYDSNRNQYDPNRNQYDPNRNQYNQYENRNDQTYGQNTYNPDNTPRPWDGGRNYGTSLKVSELEHDSVIINEATYFIVASRMVRPGQVYKISANILRARLQMTIRASISRNGVEVADVIEKVKEGVPEILNMRMPFTTAPGDYKLRVEGLYLDDPFGGRAFVNETQLTFSSRFMTIFIQLDKPVYKQGQTVKFRVIPITTELKASGRAIDVYILDPNGRIMKRWLSRQSNFGTVSLQYQMSDQPQYGEWSVRVEALGQIEVAQFLVEEYYQTRFEVNVTMPAFFFDTEPFIHGRVMANYTSGAPVRGNLTLKATVRPIPQYRPRYFTQGQFNNRGDPAAYGLYATTQYTRVRQNYNPYLYNESIQYEYTDGRNGPVDVKHLPGQPNQIDQPDWWYDPQKVYTRLFNFDEKFPFWMPKPDPVQIANQYQDYPNYNTYTTSTYNNYYNDPYYSRLPYLRYFNGTYDFKFPMSELSQLVPSLDGVEVIITASVGDPFLDDVIEGYSIARIFNSSLAVTFLGGSVQVFKPAMPFDVYMAVSYHDGSPLPRWQAAGVSLVVELQVEGRGAAIEPQRPSLAPGHEAVWHLRLDLYKLLKLENDPNYREVLNGITGVRVTAQLADAVGGRAAADVHFVPHYSPNNHHLRVSTSTTDARVPTTRTHVHLVPHYSPNNHHLRVSTSTTDARVPTTRTHVHLVPHYSPNNHHLRVSTSTTDARVPTHTHTRVLGAALQPQQPPPARLHQHHRRTGTNHTHTRALGAALQPQQPPPARLHQHHGRTGTNHTHTRALGAALQPQQPPPARLHQHHRRTGTNHTHTRALGAALQPQQPPPARLHQHHRRTGKNHTHTRALGAALQPQQPPPARLHQHHRRTGTNHTRTRALGAALQPQQPPPARLHQHHRRTGTTHTHTRALGAALQPQQPPPARLHQHHRRTGTNHTHTRALGAALQPQQPPPARLHQHHRRTGTNHTHTRALRAARHPQQPPPARLHQHHRRTGTNHTHTRALGAARHPQQPPPARLH